MLPPLISRLNTEPVPHHHSSEGKVANRLHSKRRAVVRTGLYSYAVARQRTAHYRRVIAAKRQETVGQGGDCRRAEEASAAQG